MSDSVAPGTTTPSAASDIAPLAAFGRQQLYDERCFASSAGAVEGSRPTPKSELRRRGWVAALT